jgi:hypothetical protein
MDINQKGTIIANICKASACHTETRKTKRKEREVAIVDVITGGVWSLRTEHRNRGSLNFFLFYI